MSSNTAEPRESAAQILALEQEVAKAEAAAAEQEAQLWARLGAADLEVVDRKLDQLLERLSTLQDQAPGIDFSPLKNAISALSLPNTPLVAPERLDTIAARKEALAKRVNSLNALESALIFRQREQEERLLQAGQIELALANVEGEIAKVLKAQSESAEKQAAEEAKQEEERRAEEARKAEEERRAEEARRLAEEEKRRLEEEAQARLAEQARTQQQEAAKLESAKSDALTVETSPVSRAEIESPTVEVPKIESTASEAPTVETSRIQSTTSEAPTVEVSRLSESESRTSDAPTVETSRIQSATSEASTVEVSRLSETLGTTDVAPTVEGSKLSGSKGRTSDALPIETSRTESTASEAPTVEVSKLSKIESTRSETAPIEPPTAQRSTSEGPASETAKLQTATPNIPPPPAAKRRSRRRKVRLAPPPQRLEVEVSAFGETNFFTGFDGKLKSGGLFVETFHNLPKGHELDLILKVKGREFSLRGRVLFVRSVNFSNPDSTPGAGLELLGLAKEGEELIESFFAQRPPLFFATDLAETG